MKIHDEIEEWLAAAVTDGLSPEERKNFEQHLAGCERCRILHNEQKTMSKAITGTFQNIKPNENFERRVAQNFRRKLAQEGSFSLLAWLARFTQARTVQWALALLLTIALIKGGQVLTGESRILAESGMADPVASGEILESRSDSATTAPAPAHTPSALTAWAAGSGSFKGSNAFRIESDEEKVFEFAKKPLKGGEAQTPARRLNELANQSELRRGDDLKSRAETPAKTENAEDSKGLIHYGSPIAQNAQNKNGTSPSALDFQNQKLAENASGSPMPDGAAPAQPLAEQKLIRKATLEFEVKNFDTAVESIRAITGEEQGYVATADSARGANGKLRGTVVVKMLPAHLDRYLLKLRALGELKNQRLGSDDVTKAYVDTDARLRNARVMEERLLEMLQKNTGKVSDLLQVEKELARVREQIEQMQGELKFWDTQVAYATVTISLYEKDLNQAAAFLLKERANLSLFSADVEKTYAAAKTEAETADAQVLQSKLERDSDGRISGTLSLLLAPETADQTIGRMKTLGRVQTFTTEDERVGQGGSGASDSAKVERDKVQFNLVIAHDDEARRQTTVTLVTAHVEQSLDAAKSAALAQNAEVVSSNVARDPNGHGTGQLTMRVPAKNYTTVLEALQKIGHVTSLAIQRHDRAGDEESGPVLISLTLTSEEMPVQRTNLSVLSEQVEEKSAALKQAAERASAEIKNSTFERQSGGVEVANLTILLPLQQSAPLLEQIKQFGKVSNFTVQRNEAAAPAGDSAPAQIDVHIYSRGDIVAAQNGVWPTVRRTLAQGVAAVLWSVRMIAVSLAFVLPWAAGLALLGWIVARVRRFKRK